MKGRPFLFRTSPPPPLRPHFTREPLAVLRTVRLLKPSRISFSNLALVEVLFQIYELICIQAEQLAPASSCVLLGLVLVTDQLNEQILVL